MGEKWLRHIKDRVGLWTAGAVLFPIVLAVAAPTAGLTATALAGSESAIAAVDRQMLEEVVDKALERQLGPIKEMLTQLTIRQPTLPDIVGGIGYILGLFGVWAYFLSKRNKGA